LPASRLEEKKRAPLRRVGKFLRPLRQLNSQQEESLEKGKKRVDRVGLAEGEELFHTLREKKPLIPSKKNFKTISTNPKNVYREKNAALHDDWGR